MEDQRPTLTWFPLAGAHGYEVTISDVASNYTQNMMSPRLRQTAWTVPSPLGRGRTYSSAGPCLHRRGHSEGAVALNRQRPASE